MKQTFPDVAAHIEFVSKGSSAIGASPTATPPGPAASTSPPPAACRPWSSQLTEAEIEAVVTFEREGL